jgi:prevent-host-death family protein
MPTKKQWAGPKPEEDAAYPADMKHVDRSLVVRVLANDNPKRVGYRSRERFALYRDGMTVADYVAAVIGFGDKEQTALDDLVWDQSRAFIRLEQPPSNQIWSVAEAKAKLSEILRLARAGAPQTIGNEDPCVVISAAQFDRVWQPQHLGRFLVDSAPRGADLELPSRTDSRGDPLADH